MSVNSSATRLRLVRALVVVVACGDGTDPIDYRFQCGGAASSWRGKDIHLGNRGFVTAECVSEALLNRLPISQGPINVFALSSPSSSQGNKFRTTVADTRTMCV